MTWSLLPHQPGPDRDDAGNGPLQRGVRVGSIRGDGFQIGTEDHPGDRGGGTPGAGVQGLGPFEVP